MLDDLLDRLRESGCADKIAAAEKIAELQEINFRLCERLDLARENIATLVEIVRDKKTIDPPRESA